MSSNFKKVIINTYLFYFEQLLPRTCNYLFNIVCWGLKSSFDLPGRICLRQRFTVYFTIWRQWQRFHFHPKAWDHITGQYAFYKGRQNSLIVSFVGNNISNQYAIG